MNGGSKSGMLRADGRSKSIALLLASLLLGGFFAASFGTIAAAAQVQTQDGLDATEQSLFVKGQTLYNQNLYHEAAAVFGDFLSAYPQSQIKDLALLWLGRCHIRAGDVGAAEQIAVRLRAVPDTQFVALYEEELRVAHRGYEKGRTSPRVEAPLAIAPSLPKPEAEKVERTPAIIAESTPMAAPESVPVAATLPQVPTANVGTRITNPQPVVLKESDGSTQSVVVAPVSTPTPQPVKATPQTVKATPRTVVSVAATSKVPVSNELSKSSHPKLTVLKESAGGTEVPAETPASKAPPQVVKTPPPTVAAVTAVPKVSAPTPTSKISAPKPVVAIESTGTRQAVAVPTAPKERLQTKKLNPILEGSKTVSSAGPLVRLRVEQGPREVASGPVTFYRLLIVNEGRGIAKNLTVNELLPDDLEFASSDPAPSQQEYTGRSQKLTFRILELKPGATRALRIAVRPRAGATSEMILKAKHSVSYQDSEQRNYLAN